MAGDSNGTRKRTAIVVGAGAGGISSAARLAKAGFSVTVLEKNNFTGGRCSLIESDGHRFDQGPSLLLLPDMFHEAFTDLGTSMAAEGVELLKCEPNYSLWYGDGASIQLSTDTALMKREVERWEGKDGFERYLAFLRESHRHYELSVTHVLKKSFNSYFSILRPAFLRHLLSLHPFESIYSRAARYFRTERLRRAFTFGSMYMGMSPFDAPGTYSLLQYTELAEGIWYPRGGFHAVLGALEKVAKRLGVDFRLGTPVASVTVDRSTNRATGVTLVSGEQLSADIVLVNADLVYAYNNLLPPSNYGKRLAKRATSCSSISFYWSLDTKLPQLGTHNIFLADDYRDSFDRIFRDHVLPREPSFYVNVPSRIDPSAAPEGKDSLVVLVPCGHLIDEPENDKQAQATARTNGHTNGDANGSVAAKAQAQAKATGIPASKQDFPKLVAHARQTVISVLNKRLAAAVPSAYPSSMTTTTINTAASPLPPDFDISRHIAHESVNDPATWRARFNLDRGAILGLAHDFFNVLCFRPRIREEAHGIKGCYFVGASTQPGTGVPIVLAGSRVVVAEICKDHGVEVPWLREERQAEIARRSRPVDPLDVERWLTYELLGWFVLLAVPVLLAVAVAAGWLGAEARDAASEWIAVLPLPQRWDQLYT